MNSLAYLTPVVVSVTSALLLKLGQRSHSKLLAGYELFFYPRVYGSMFAAGSIFFACLSLFPKFFDDPNPTAFSIFMMIVVMMTFSALCLSGAVYFVKFKVLVSKETFSIGVLKLRACLKS